MKTNIQRIAVALILAFSLCALAPVVSAQQRVIATGNAASEDPDSGSPIKVGGKYNSTQPTATNADRVDLQVTSRGALIVAPGTEGFALTANQSVNVNQIGGNTVSTGNGATGTGSIRVTLANDSSAIAGKGEGATGAAPPSGAVQIGGIGSGATGGLLAGIPVCDQWVAINTAASAQLITGVSGRKVYFCSGNIQMNGGANTLTIVSGTGSTCGTGTTAIPGFDGSTTAANGYSFAANSGMNWGGGLTPFARSTNNADNICILLGSATRVVGGLNFAIY